MPNKKANEVVLDGTTRAGFCNTVQNMPVITLSGFDFILPSLTRSGKSGVGTKKEALYCASFDCRVAPSDDWSEINPEKSETIIFDFSQ